MKILLSIKPQYVEKIFSGKKLFEYRKVIFKKGNIDTIVIYATKPVGKIVGEAKIAYVHKDTPEKIWYKTKQFSGITQNDFFQYFTGKKIAYAIELKDIVMYETFIELKGAPPQSYRYV